MNRRKAKKIFKRACNDRTGHSTVTLTKAYRLIMKQNVLPSAAVLAFTVTRMKKLFPYCGQNWKGLNDQSKEFDGDGC